MKDYGIGNSFAFLETHTQKNRDFLNHSSIPGHLVHLPIKTNPLYLQKVNLILSNCNGASGFNSMIYFWRVSFHENLQDCSKCLIHD